MKTTVDLPDDLLERAKAYARARGITLRELIAAGLRSVMREAHAPDRFVLRDASFRGRGLRPEFQDASWERLRDEIYKGRGS
jgi:hypothetical protein